MRRARSSIRYVVACASVALVAATFAGCSDQDVTNAAVTIAPTADATATVAEPITTLLFTGDIIPVRCTFARLEALGDYSAPFHALGNTLRSADLTIGTLDTTISTVAQPIGCTPTFNLAAPARVIDGLTYAGYDVLAHAANHVKDCGAINCGDQAMFETIWLLKSAGIQPVGTGGDLREARAPVVLERNGVWFVFLAYDDIAPYYQATETSPGTAPLDASTVAADIAAARNFADVVIVLPNWGVEYTAAPTARQRAFARAAADAGADLVVGNHPHWVQAYERIGDTLVAYALGNFVFDQDWSRETQQGAMLEVTLTGADLTSYRFIPIRIHDQYQPRIAEPDEAWEILRRIEIASDPLRGQ